MQISKDKVIKIADFGWAQFESLITGIQCGTLFSGGRVEEIFTDHFESDEEISPPTEVEGYLSGGPKEDGSVAPPAGWTKVMISCCNPSPERSQTATECKELILKITGKYEK